MKSWQEIERELIRLEQRADVLTKYRDHCATIGDHHGVQDAASDLREIEAVDTALRWTRDECEKVGV